MKKDLFASDITELLPPSEDGVFKTLLTHPGAKPVLRDVISAVIGIPVSDATVRNVELPITGINEKRERFDVNCTFDDGGQADVEMQSDAVKGDSLRSGHAILKSRAIFNLCDLHSSQEGRGVRYDKMMRSFQVMFCGYPVFVERDGFVHRFNFRDEKGVMLSDMVGIIFIELSELDEVMKKPVGDMTDLEMWSVFFAHASEPEYRDVLKKLTDAKGEIKVATELLRGISKDEVERAHFRSRRMFRMDMESDLAVAREEGEAMGEARGEARGEANKAIAIAKNLFLIGLPIEQIARATGLGREDVERLRDRN